MLTVAPAQALDPTSFSPGASHQQPNLSLGTGTIVAGPDRLLDLVRPVTLEGIMTSDPSTGLMSLQTSLGPVTIQPNGALPPGQAVIVQITPGNPPTITLTSQQTGSQQSGTQQVASPSQTLPSQPASVIVPPPAANGVTLPGQVITAIPIPAGAITTTTPEISTENLAALPITLSQQAASAQAPVTPAQPAQPARPLASPPTLAPAATSASPASALPPSASPTSVSPTPASPNLVSPTLASPTSVSTPPSGPQTGATAVPPSQALPSSPSTGTAEIFFTAAPQQLGAPPSAPASPQYQQFLSLIDAQVAGLARPAEQPAGQTAGEVPAQPAMQLPAAANDTPAAPFAVQILTITPPGAAAAPQVAGAIVGVVTGATLSGQPILQTDAGSFILQTAGPLPAGTQITLSQAAPPLPSQISMLVAPPLDIQRGKTWPVLSQSLQVLAATQPNMADAIRLAMPQAGPLMAPLLLQFIGGMRTGNTRAWLSDKTLDALRHAGRGDLADALASDLDNIGRQAITQTADGWRTIPVPLLLQGELGRLQLYLKPYPSADEQGGRSEEDERTGTRFLIEVEPSAVGPIQLDGLVRNSNAAYSAPLLDMILRSRTPIPQGMQRDIGKIFADSLAASGLKGGIIFQGAGYWVTVGRNRQAPHGVVA